MKRGVTTCPQPDSVHDGGSADPEIYAVVATLEVEGGADRFYHLPGRWSLSAALYLATLARRDVGTRLVTQSDFARVKAVMIEACGDRS